mgnify:CR=1 FL=1
MQDIAGCRLILPDMVVQEEVIERLRRAFAKVVIIDRRQHPSHGYRAVHVIAASRQKVVEIQVRTALQHLWAELSEKLSDVIHQAIKYGGGEPRIHDLLMKLSVTIGDFEDLEVNLGGVDSHKQLESMKHGLRNLLEYIINRPEIIGGEDAIFD